MRGGPLLLCLVVAAGGTAVRGPGAPVARPAGTASSVAAALRPFIEHEMRDKRLPGLSIALVEDQRTVWASGFGLANPADSTSATAATRYPVGDLSSLFTGIALMQLVEQRRLDLDAPVSRYLPRFGPHDPFGGAITVRELLAHRAGLVREPPVGSAFDTTAATLARTVASLNGTSLVYPPGTHTKYSSAGIAVAEAVLEAVGHDALARALQRAVFEPMGLTSSVIGRDSASASRAAAGFMWTLDGRTFPAPPAAQGAAAGNMHTTVEDMARFLSVLFAGGRGAHGRVIRPAALDSMWMPRSVRSASDDELYGIGFALGALDGHRVVGLDGGPPGFSSRLAALPDERLGVAVVTNVDGAGAVTSRIANEALRLLLAERARRPLVAPETTLVIPDSLARSLAGRYGSGGSAEDLDWNGRDLYLDPARGGARARLRLPAPAAIPGAATTFVTDGRLSYGSSVTLLATGALVVARDTLQRVSVARPAPPPTPWRGLIGEYGRTDQRIYVLERDGRLEVLMNWFYRYPLEQANANEFRFPPWGRYDHERVAFTRDANGRATTMRVGGTLFRRLATGPEDGSQFRITPVRSVSELRREALAAQPPYESGRFRPSDLVELVTLDSTIHLDIRYATSNNFLGTPMYRHARAFLQRPAAEAVVRASAWLRARGFGLLIHDAYRPWYVTKMFWDATPPDKHVFVADPAEGSRHNRGCAVDLTLYDRATGRPVAMTGGYDEMTDRSYPDYPGGTSRQRWDRALLRRAMEMQGFTVYDAEWWHFDYRDWREYGIGNTSLGG